MSACGPRAAEHGCDAAPLPQHLLNTRPSADPLRPSHYNASATAPQGGDAKANVCSAYAAARKAVVINTQMNSPNPHDPIAELSVAANARLALLGSGTYLRERPAANTAAPGDLANSVNSMANTIQQLGINYLTGAAPDVQDPLRHDLTSEITQIDKLCA